MSRPNVRLPALGSAPVGQTRGAGLAASAGDRAVAFALTRRRSGLYVERALRRRGAGQVRLTLRFEDESAFVRWCNADQLQFDFPLVYANLRRNGCALLCDKPAE